MSPFRAVDTHCHLNFPPLCDDLDGVLPAETEPQHVADVAAALATIRGEDIAVIAAQTTANARALFNLPEKY